MGKVAVVTDSTSYIPPEYLAKHNISSAPQVLIWDNQTYEDGVDIQPGEFYQRLSQSKTMPSTSQVTPATFQKIYTDLVSKGYDEILTIVLSNKLSGTIVSAQQVKERFKGAKIEIVDSFTTAMALGFIVLTAARAAQDGATLAECKVLAEKARENVGVLFAVDTLEFLHRGGRITGAKWLLGTALTMKPLLEVTGGQVESIERVRTRTKSLNRLIEVLEARIGDRKPVRLATLHANCPSDAQYLLEAASLKLSPIENIFTEVSPVVGTHAGPGTVGLAFMAGM
jgi:DegV family protein with EDD domain